MASATNIRLLLGGDSHQRKLILDEIQQRRYGSGDVERLYFDAATGDTERAIDEVLSFSLFNPDRIVILDRLESISKPDTELLVTYAGHPRGDTPFLLYSPSEKETPSDLLKVLDKKTIRVLPKTGKAEIQKLIRDHCVTKQVTFETQAMSFFMQECGDSVETALRELDKLILGADDKGTITLDLCKRLIQTEQDADIWAITNAVGDKKIVDALLALDQLLAQGDDEISITARLIPAFRSMYDCKTLMGEKASDAEMGKRVKALSLTKKRSQSFTLPALRRCLARLHRMDNDLKGGRSVPSTDHKRILLERLVIDLCTMS